MVVDGGLPICIKSMQYVHLVYVYVAISLCLFFSSLVTVSMVVETEVVI